MFSRPRPLPPGFIAPCLPTSAPQPPSGELWLHEIKHDGFRVIACKLGKRVKLYSRPGNDLTYRFPLIVESLARLRSRSCIIDGEAVACGEDSTANFGRIRYRHHDAGVFLYAFDLIELDGEDMRRDPLAVRKATLASLLRRAAPGLRFNEHLDEENQTALVAYAEQNDLAYEYEYTPAFAKQRLLSPEQYEIVEARTSRGVSWVMLFSKAIIQAEWEANAPLREALAIKRERLRVAREAREKRSPKPKKQQQTRTRENLRPGRPRPGWGWRAVLRRQRRDAQQEASRRVDPQAAGRTAARISQTAAAPHMPATARLPDPVNCLWRSRRRIVPARGRSSGRAGYSLKPRRPVEACKRQQSVGTAGPDPACW